VICVSPPTSISFLVGSFNSILRSNMLALQSASAVSTFGPTYLKYGSVCSVIRIYVLTHPVFASQTCDILCQDDSRRGNHVDHINQVLP